MTASNPRDAWRRLGILGGTFDPPHIGHLIMAREIAETLELDHVLFVPAYRPPHKDDKQISAQDHRLHMLQLALAGEPGFSPDRRELARGGKSYTVTTLRELRGEHGPDTEIFFLIGADTLPELPTWHQASELPSLAHFATAVRPGFSLECEAVLRAAFAESVVADLLAHQVETTPIGISSSQIRRNVFLNKSIRHLVPDEVASYIHDRGLYRSSPDKSAPERKKEG